MTILQLLRNSKKDLENFELFFSEFLDEFYRNDINKKKKMVANAPEFFEEIPIEKYAFIAGAVEKICNDSNITPPEWVYNKTYFLKDPYFAMNAKGHLRLFLLFESPNEFLVRNVFVPSNALIRV